tara:strand:- start:3195 stop:3587 length:393 start_codon:yes stop_codon:yes gene_type:complete
MELFAKWILIFFGIFLICTGFLMLFYPVKARETIKKAGSTPFINYTEITVRMIPAAAFVIYAGSSKFTLAFLLLGWFMLGTSLILYFIPRKWHHQYALKCAAILSPLIIQYISPLSLFFGTFILYGTIAY